MPIGARFGVFVLLFAAAVRAESPAALPGGAADRAIYLVALQGPSVLERLGRSRAKLDDASARARAEQAVRAEQEQVWTHAAAVRAKTTAPPRAVYRYVANGFALALSAEEAEQWRSVPGVAAVEPEFERWVQMDAGPAWIGAPPVWSGAALGRPVRGEGVVVGVIDTGINAAHPAFADPAPDGYDHPNLRGRRYGLCTGGSPRCNDKLIGIYEYTSEGNRDGSDLDGHGSHVASTAVGNPFSASSNFPTLVQRFDLSGVAPRAHLISYKACQRGTQGSTSTCPGSALLQALEQAVLDQVDVINYSIGGDPRDPWTALTSTALSDYRAMFNARAAGVVVVVAAGNRGPDAASQTGPANAPWVLSVANSTSDRRFVTRLTGLSGTPAPPQLEFVGLGLTAGTAGPARLVLGEQRGSALCSQGQDLDFPPTGASNPFAPNSLAGLIVICDRGVQARVAKSFNVAQAGAVGMVLVNTAAEGESTVADGHYVPATHLGFSAGEELKRWIRGATDPRGRITATAATADPSAGDVLAASSGRGPDPAGAGVLKPNLSAPGTSIIAAAAEGGGIATLSGTSMATPHVAGAAALLRSARPDWGPAQIESALQLTANATQLRREDGQTPAAPLERGAGRVQVQRAVAARLYFPLAAGDFQAANPRQGGNPRRLNLPQLYDAACNQRCSFERSVQDLAGGGSWTLSVAGPPELGVTLQPSSFTLAANARQDLRVELDVSHPRFAGAWVHAELIFTAGDGASMRVPISVHAVGGVPPTVQRFTIDQQRGRLDLSLGGMVALPAAYFAAIGFEPAQRVDTQLPVDPSPSSALDGSAGTLTQFVDLPPAGAGARWWQWVVEASSSSAQDLNLYVGADDDGNGQVDARELLCSATSGTNLERCVLTDPRPRRYWWVVQNARASVGGASDPIQVDFGGVRSLPESGAPARAAGPGRVAAGASFALHLGYELGGLRHGEKAFGAVLPYALPDNPQPAVIVPVVLERRSSTPPRVQILEPGRVLRASLRPGEAHEYLLLDVPPGAERLRIDARGEGNVDLYLAPAPRAGGTPGIGAAPPRGSAVARATGPTSAERIELDSTSLTPGRYYLTPVNAGGSEARFELEATLSMRPTEPSRAAVYFNPERSGHGLFVTRARDDAQVVWYTYDDDGRPTWYLIFPSGFYDSLQGTSGGDIYRFTWDGGRATPTAVGRAVFTRLEPTRLVFSWSLLGVSGSEPMQLLAESACAAVAPATPRDVGGLWYEPARSGYGANVIVRPSQELHAFYLYDADGVPRWVLGDNQPFGAARRDLRQFRGFCPTCSHVAPTSSIVGFSERSYSEHELEPLGGTWRLVVGFVDGVPGGFERDTATILRLTAARPCAPP